VARSLEAGDISPSFVSEARRHYGELFRIAIGDAQSLSFASGSKDVIVLFEAIYYLRDARAFISECARVLRRGGHVLIVTANKDLWDFHPSAHSQKYYGVSELGELLSGQGFDCEFFGFQDVHRSNLRQRLLRPLKRLAVAANWMPRTMAGKRWLKRIVFGAEVRMPAELAPDSHVYVAPERISGETPDKRHRIIYCAARLRGAVAENRARSGAGAP
jgi:SAM-dependent methyltransferase